ncbi:hypothetical protein EBT31_06360 [bacterium]|nr:hypothetical protein [bacterium]NBX48941.1 hypothetical protein [bacterium]
MRTLLVLLLVAAVVWALRSSKEFLVSPVVQNQTVPAKAIQAIINKVTSDRPELYPLDTVFVDADGSNITGRFLFLDTRNYAGVQYDVSATLMGPSEVSVNSMKTTVNPNLDGPFLPYGKASYIKYPDIKSSVNAQISG